MNVKKVMSTIFMVVFSCIAHSEKLKPLLSDRNDFWNRYITYISEPIGEDYWQSPEETWLKKTGDCEDYAIIKYFDLIASGIEKEKLSLAWVILDNKFNIKQKYESHIVVLYEINGEKWVLDNYASSIIDLNNRSDIVLVNAIINQEGIIVFHGKGEKIKKQWEKINKDFNKNLQFINKLQPNLELEMLGISTIK